MTGFKQITAEYNSARTMYDKFNIGYFYYETMSDEWREIACEHAFQLFDDEFGVGRSKALCDEMFKYKHGFPHTLPFDPMTGEDA